ncbi:unnamed protein product [Nippostrongylus brasiliensis]|uniref:ULP_PROTEASE domain-containing protein n=1 Tax=Nippostrongylus brasiliensis TaxID=27835 RepID=A0A0N4XE67_NIPBR|nr:unnamed protein product [Nippostrongylus brasiliensis]
MHIFVPGDGLCSTHVTWDDIEEDMQLSLNTSASFGPDKNVKDIGDGKVSSKLNLPRYRYNWQPQQEELPKNFVVKVRSRQKVLLHFSRMLFLSVHHYHPYRRLRSTPLAKDRAATRWLRVHRNMKATIYSMKKFTESNLAKGYIIMEFYKDMNGAELHRNVTPDSLKPVSSS